jgi:hypothetical protein
MRCGFRGEIAGAGRFARPMRTLADCRGSDERQSFPGFKATAGGCRLPALGVERRRIDRIWPYGTGTGPHGPVIATSPLMFG